MKIWCFQFAVLKITTILFATIPDGIKGYKRTPNDVNWRHLTGHKAQGI
jgi:hypothetical protein